MSKSKTHELSASECLELFSELPDGAAYAAAAEVYGESYDDFMAALAEECEVGNE